MWSREAWFQALPKAQFKGNLEVLETVENFFIDSRRIPENGFFVPLAGEHTDGHQFLSSVFASGVRAAFSALENAAEAAELLKNHPENCVVLVPDVLVALADFARAHLLAQKDVVRIGVTGSNGKTTTKEMLAAALSAHGPTFSSQGNFNSEIGLPLTALGMAPGHRFAVFEMGINHPGEMEILASVARPAGAVVTNIGTAHIGILGSQLNIALEKKKIFSFIGTEGFAVLPASDPFLPELTKDFRGRVCLFGEGLSEFRFLEDRGLKGSVFSWRGIRVALPLMGRHNVRNALAVLTTVDALGLDPAKSVPALEALKPFPGRGEFLEGRIRLLSDGYNANYESMLGLFEFLKTLTVSGRTVIVLGSMKELGDRARELHESLGREAARLKADALYFFGPETEASYQACLAEGFTNPLSWTDDIEELKTLVGDFVRDGDLVVLKGSRGVALERLIPLWFAREEGTHVL